MTNANPTSTQSKKDQSSHARRDPIEIVPGVEIVDAFVDFNLGNAGPAELVAVFEDGTEIDPQWATPVVGESGNLWIAEAGLGLVFGFQDGPVGVPADEPDITRTIPVEHADGRVEDRVPMLHHTVEQVKNDQVPNCVQSITYYVGESMQRPTSIPTRVTVLQLMLDRYVNGPLGSDAVSMTWYQREIERKYSWRDLQIWADREDFQQVNRTTPVLVQGGVYTWICKPRADVTDDDTTYEEWIDNR